MSGTTLTQASHQWATRPNDQRFVDMAALKQHVQNRRDESWTATPATRSLRVLPQESGDVAVEVYDPTRGDNVLLNPSHWGFGQLAGYANAPASYLRSLPAELAAINLQWGLERNPVRDGSLVLAQSNGHHTLRSMTAPTYGRIWDSQVVQAVENVNKDGRWQIPASSYTTTNPLRATTLYASDRDVFIFLVDPQNEIMVRGEKLFRGFFVWNSEVGAATFGLTTFLYRYVCDNRMVWGATHVNELRIRHTGGAPDRFAYEGQKYLARYAEESTAQVIDGIARAMDTEIPNNEGAGETVEQWLRSRGFTQTQAKAAVTTAQAEEGKVRSVWDIVNGITAYARSIPHTDSRIELETKAGKLLDMAAR